MFLAGAGAFLQGARGKSRSELAGFLVTRGLWLVVLELTVVRLGWAFDLNYAGLFWVPVIWVIGVSMVMLAGLVYLPLPAIAAFGLVMITTHNLFDGITPRVARRVGPALDGASRAGADRLAGGRQRSSWPIRSSRGSA